ncbi:MAG: protoporphyrinogen oxidase [Nocardioidaceae bacterium]|nr:protoporphyrinogen oxidase [Nocardioidaceae bacterium]
MSVRVAVVGGGITGLAAAHALTTSASDVEVVVLEGSPRIGGKLLVGEVAGLPVDLGAEVMLNRRPEAVALARVAGLGDDLTHPEPIGSSIWTRGALLAMPRTVMGVPADLPGLAGSGVLSRTGVLRVRAEPFLPGSALSEAQADDLSVGDFLARRLGSELVDRIVEPLLGGVYAGHARRLSLAAAAPQVQQLAVAGRSLVRAAQRVSAQPVTTSSPVFAGLRGGVGRLPAAVASASGAQVETSATVRLLTRASATRWRLVVGSTHDARLLEVDAVVLATPAAPASRLLDIVAPAAARELRRIEYAGMAVITLAYPAGALGPPLTSSGFLVPPVEGRDVKASTFSSAKWAWLREAGEREGGITVVRASVGRHGQEHLVQREDTELVELAAGDLAEAAGLRGPLIDAQVTRWGGALPQYSVGHRSRVQRIRAAVTEVEGLEVCGAAYDGVGIAACVADGTAAAHRLLEQLGRRGTMKP